jgi:hypothetical protein
VRAHPFLTRLALATLGLLVLTAGGIVALGWAVSYGNSPIQVWVSDQLGEDRWERLHCGYARILGAVFPADSDGDGFPDSVERYERSGPDNPASYPDWTFLKDMGDDLGFTALDFEMHRESGCLLLQPGERRHMRLRIGIRDHPASFAPHAKWGLYSDSSAGPMALLALPGESEAQKSLLVPVSREGFMDFDLVAPVDAESLGGRVFDVWGTNPKGRPGDDAARALDVAVASPLPSLPCSTKDVSIEEVAEGEGDYHFVDGKRLVRVMWEPAKMSGPCFIEATRDQTGRNWRVVAVGSIEQPGYLIAYELHETPPGHWGPLRFRVVPTRTDSPKD